jgi:NADH-quinone oxidoreductase subunit M
LVISLSSMGLPGLNGFIGEFTILMGALGSEFLGFFFTLFGTLGVIMAAVYILYMFQHVFMGETKVPHGEEVEGFDLKLGWNEIAAIIPILIMIFWIGLQPGGFFDIMNESTNELVADINNAMKRWWSKMGLKTTDL